MIFRLLLPIGLLGLAGIIALLLIYLLKPQYKTKKVSTTLVWKRVLLTKKRQFPYLSQILLFILQAAVIALFALSLSEPYLFHEDVLPKGSEYVLIIDTSASMRARKVSSPEEGTRFERAVKAAKEKADEILSGNGVVYVMLAGETPEYIVPGYGRERREEVDAALDSAECSLQKSDLESAINLAAKKLDANPSAKIFLYTDTDFADMGTAFEAINFADEAEEWNAGVLGCEVAVRDNEYVFTVSVGVYGDVSLGRVMQFDISGADNGNGRRDYNLRVPLFLDGGSTGERVITATVRASDENCGGENGWFFDSFDEVKITLPDLNDSIPDDDVYFVYGGVRDAVKVEYWSADPNRFWQLGFNTISKNVTDSRLVSFREIYHDEGEMAENSGYDLYIFEHSIPSEVLTGGMPDDGVIVVMDPDATFSRWDTGLKIGGTAAFDQPTACVAPEYHPLVEYINAENIRLTRYKRVETEEGSPFIPLIFCGSDPVLLYADTEDFKMVVLPFSINMSNFYGREFCVFLYDLLNFYMPRTLNKYDFTIGESATVECKGVSVEVLSQGVSEVMDKFPGKYRFESAGTYVFTIRFGLNKPEEIRKAYVHVSGEESKIFASSDFAVRLDNGTATGAVGTDIFLYLAIAILIIMIAEWLVHFKSVV